MERNKVFALKNNNNTYIINDLINVMEEAWYENN